MRHRVKTKKLNRHQGARKGLELSLTRALIIDQSISTTLAKAKYIRPKVEKLVTFAKKGDTLANKRILLSRVNNEKKIVAKIYDFAKKYKNTNGGYTKILKAGNRAGDNAQMAKLMWVEVSKPVQHEEKPVKAVEKKANTAKTSKKPTAKKPAKKVEKNK